MPQDYQVVIVGTGPVGAAFARRLVEQGHRDILMVEAGAALTQTSGVNIRNLEPKERETAYAEAQLYPLAQISQPVEGSLVARPGTHLLRHDAMPQPDDDKMPAAAMSSNVGGMGAHWTCACPRPGDSEKIDFIPETRMDAAFTKAETYLGVTQQGFPQTAIGDYVVRALQDAFAPGRSADRLPQPMPLACAPQANGVPRWAGADVVLGALATAEGRAKAGVELRDQTLCRRVLFDGHRATGVELVNRRDGNRYRVSARVVVVAADALRTPQLLQASGLKSAALGRYLNDQPQTIALIQLDPGRAWSAAELRKTADGRDNVSGVSWLPFHEPEFPFHGQLMQMDTSPIPLQPGETSLPVVGLGLFAAKTPRAQDRIRFLEETDAMGLPRMELDYALTAEDRALQDQAVDWVERIGAALGRVAPGGGARVLPAGTSLHYQGTHRIGPADDGTSVCDATSRVWGVDNLYLGGNGTIPTATACNPTLTAVALAIIAAEALSKSHLQIAEAV